MKEQHIGKMIYYGLRFFTWVRNRFGKRWYMVHKSWNVHKYALGVHFRGVNEFGEYFVYCPVSLLLSFSRGDYDHEYCHACQLFYHDKMRAVAGEQLAPGDMVVLDDEGKARRAQQ